MVARVEELPRQYPGHDELPSVMSVGKQALYDVKNHMPDPFEEK